MNIDKSMIFDNYYERMKRLALFEPLYSLQNKRKLDDNNKPINLFELGLLTLLFFFENRLIRNHTTGIKELSSFLYELVSERYELKSTVYEVLARQMIETFRPPSGKRLSKQFYNFETSKEEVLYYSILKAGKSNLEDNKQYYELDEDGLELIFSTREYFSEYQISISQMLLRKQLEKGEFISALRQIDEMNLNVISLSEQITKIMKEIHRNITSENTLNRYKKLIDDINNRLTREHNEFGELRAFVIETITRLKNNISSDKDRDVYSHALRVSKQLEKVHNAHTILFNDSILTKNTALVAAKESLYYVGVESFNFNKEVVNKITSEPLTLDKLHNVTKPFLSIEKTEIWSPISVFFTQRVTNKDETEINLEYLELNNSEEEDSKYIEKIYAVIMSLLVEYMNNNNTVILSEFINHLKASENIKYLDTRYFYDFWITLHQLSPIDVLFDEDDKTHNLLVEALHLLRNRFKKLIVNENTQIIDVTKRFSISEMKLELEERHKLN